MAFGVIGKLVMDLSPWKQGLDKAVGMVDKANADVSKEVGKDFKKGLKKTIGAAAVAGAIIAELKDAQEVRNGAEALGVTSQMFAAMEIAAKQLGDTSNVTNEEFMRLTQSLIDAGEVASSDTINKLAEQGDNLDTFIRNLKRAGDEIIAFLFKITQAIANVVTGSFYGVNMKTGEKQEGNIFQRLFNPRNPTAVKNAYDNFMDAFTAKPEEHPATPRTNAKSLEERIRDKYGLFNPLDTPKDTPKEKAEKAMKAMSLVTGSGWASTGVGQGFGMAHIQRDILSESRRTVGELRKLNAKIDEKL